MNDNFCITKELKLFEIYSNLHLKLLDVLLKINSINDCSISNFIYESILGFYLIIISKVDVEEIDFKIGLLNSNNLININRIKYSKEEFAKLFLS